jgi:hypothetical protein
MTGKGWNNTLPTNTQSRWRESELLKQDAHESNHRLPRYPRDHRGNRDRGARAFQLKHQQNENTNYS